MVGMTDEAAFLATIIASPEDDEPRLVYSDWLEEHKQAELAEFIRIQIKIAATGISDSRQVARVNEIRNQHEVEWLINLGLAKRKTDGVHVNADEVQYRRGFLEVIAMRWEQWKKHAPKLLVMTPIREVVLAQKIEMMSYLTDQEYAADTITYWRGGDFVTIERFGKIRFRYPSVASAASVIRSSFTVPVPEEKLTPVVLRGGKAK